jgi:antitoxin FitA
VLNDAPIDGANARISESAPMAQHSADRAAIASCNQTNMQPFCTMASITLKNIPEPLYDRLKAAAARNRRSLNGEAIARLERSLGLAPVDADALLARARAVREQAPLPYLTDDALRAAREEGRE